MKTISGKKLIKVNKPLASYDKPLSFKAWLMFQETDRLIKEQSKENEQKF